MDPNTEFRSITNQQSSMSIYIQTFFISSVCSLLNIYLWMLWIMYVLFIQINAYRFHIIYSKNQKQNEIIFLNSKIWINANSKENPKSEYAFGHLIILKICSNKYKSVPRDFQFHWRTKTYFCLLFISHSICQVISFIWAKA